MISKKKCDSFHRKSIVQLKPLPLFKEWIIEHSKNDPLKRSYDQVYDFNDPESWVIARVDTFDDYIAFDKYLATLKPKLLYHEIQSVYGGLNAFPYPITENTFDLMFELEVSSTIVDIKELDQ